MAKSASLAWQAAMGQLQLLVMMTASVFLSSWTLDYWQAWLYMAVFIAVVVPISFYFLKHDPALLRRRMKAGPAAEKEKSQKIIQVLAQIIFIALMVVPGFDRRFGWSRVPVWVVVAGDVLLTVGLLMVFFVFRENSFTSAVIEVDKGQQVISTGPYGMVRHPMYTGSLVMMIGIPLALGSWYGLLAWLPMVVLIVVRLLHEEKYLSKNLTGYTAYCAKTPYRLIPGIY